MISGVVTDIQKGQFGVATAALRNSFEANGSPDACVQTLNYAYHQASNESWMGTYESFFTQLPAELRGGYSL